MTTQGTTATADLNSPVFMIEHLAQLFGVRIDSAREHTYRSDFPPARDLGARLLCARRSWPGSAGCPSAPPPTASAVGWGADTVASG